MSKTINTFKNRNTTNALVSSDTKITNIRFVNGKIVARFDGISNAATLSGFDQACKVVNAAVNLAWGKASHRLTVYNGTSAASHKMMDFVPVASNTKYNVAFIDPDLTNIAKGGLLTLIVSGASWANKVAGDLVIDTIPN